MSWGDHSTLPERLKTRVTPSTVIYWSSAAQDQPIGQAHCGDSVGILIVCPCFWIHFILLSPCIFCCSYYAKSKALRTDVVLTRTTLELIEENGPQRSVALHEIQSITATAKSVQVCAPKCCMKDVNRLIIDDGRVAYGNDGSTHSVKTIIWAHENIDEFRRLILETKDGKIQTPFSLVMSRSNDNQQAMIMMQEPRTTLGVGQVAPYAGLETNPASYPSRFS